MISCSQPAGTELENRVPGVATISPLAAAAIATTLGGIAIVGTRFLVGHTDPLTLAFSGASPRATSRKSLSEG